jgi:hypothetical protein
MICHPERSLPRIARQTESKDLQLLLLLLLVVKVKRHGHL